MKMNAYPQKQNRVNFKLFLIFLWEFKNLNNMKVFFANYSLIILSAFLDSYAALIVKKQFNHIGQIDYSSWYGFFSYLYKFIQYPLLITAVIAFVAAPVVSFLALSKLELSVSYPVLVGFHLVFAFFFGVMFLGEKITLYKTIGALLIFVSIYLFYQNN